jgi:hypothetical protein
MRHHYEANLFEFSRSIALGGNLIALREGYRDRWVRRRVPRYYEGIRRRRVSTLEARASPSVNRTDVIRVAGDAEIRKKRVAKLRAYSHKRWHLDDAFVKVASPDE